MKRTLLLVIVGLVAVAVVGAVAFAYVVTRPPSLVSVTVADGSTIRMIEGNLTSYNPVVNSLVLDFAATTYANETDGAASTLILRLHTWTYYDGTAGAVFVNINATVRGTFASGLHPTNLQLQANQTGADGELQSYGGWQLGSNVSFDLGQSFGFDNGSGVLSATIAGGASRFSYSDYFVVLGRPWYNRFAGFRATVTGPFAPAVSVGILLEIINTNGGTWA